MVIKFIHAFVVVAFFTGSIHAAATAAPGSAPASDKKNIYQTFKIDEAKLSKERHFVLRDAHSNTLKLIFGKDFLTYCSCQLVWPTPVSRHGTFTLEPIKSRDSVLFARFSPGGMYIAGAAQDPAKKDDANNGIYFFLLDRKTLQPLYIGDSYKFLQQWVCATTDENRHARGIVLADIELPNLGDGMLAIDVERNTCIKIKSTDVGDGTTARRLFIEYLDQDAIDLMIEGFSLRQMLFLTLLHSSKKEYTVCNFERLPISYHEATALLGSFPAKIQKYLIETYRISGQVYDITPDDAHAVPVDVDDSTDLMTVGTGTATTLSHGLKINPAGAASGAYVGAPFSPVARTDDSGSVTTSTYTALTNGRAPQETAPSSGTASSTGAGGAAGGAGGSAPSRDDTD